jgi:hypothetical protein
MKGFAMEPNDLTSASLPDPVPTARPSAPPDVLAGPGLPKLIWLWSVIAGVTAGAVAWAGGETTYDYYQPSKAAASEPYAFRKLNAEKDVADGRNAAVAYGLLGAATGLAMGLTAGLARRSVGWAVCGALTGLVLGGLLPALVSPWVVPLHRKLYLPQTPDLMLPIMVHGAIWCAAGLAAGFAFGVGLGGRRRLFRGALGGLIGAAIATVLIDVLGAALFPFSRADLPIAETASVRLLSRVGVAGGIALCAAWVVLGTPRKASSNRPMA